MELSSYSRLQYTAGTQSWAMAQDSKGRLMIANNEGLLAYDGTNWQLYPVPNGTILRSIALANDGKLYAGAQDELGYYAPNTSGQLQFTSLKNLLPEQEKNFTDVWEVKAAGNEIFFRTKYKTFRLHNGTISIYKPGSAWLSLFKHNGQVVAHDEQKGLLIFQNGEWQPFIDSKLLPAGFIVTDAMPYHKDSSLISTTRNGLFVLAKNSLLPFTLSQPLAQQHYTCLAAADENSFWAGTYSKGIYHINSKGEALENIDSKNGLPNNTVRCLYADKNGDVWTGLDNGLAFLACNNAVKHVSPAAFNNGSGYSVKHWNGNLYFALSTGLYCLPLPPGTTSLGSVNKEPQLILGGQTWNISIVNNQLLVGRDDGFWKINNQQASLVSSNTGYWAFEAIPNTSPAMIAAGNYWGVRLYQNENGNFSDKGPVEKFSESSRYIEMDDKYIWVSHPYRGIFQISLADYSTTLFTQKNGLPADLDNHVFKIKNQIVFATTKGIYQYDAASGKIIPAKEYAALFGNMPVRYLKEDEKGNIWFVQGKMTGVADYSQAKPFIYYIPELKNLILSGFENIYPYNTQNVFIGSESGFYHINYEKYRQNILPVKPYITTVQIIGQGDSVLFGGYSIEQKESSKPLAIPYVWNSLHFGYAASLYGRRSAEYSYYLEGFDKGWSNWGSRPEKDYTNLPEGKYTFRIKARSGPTAAEPEEYRFSFSILPPWYRTIWAYLLYAAAVAAFLFALFKYQGKRHHRRQEERRNADQKKFEEEQRQLAYQHQLELEKSEKELMKLRNENLEAEIEFKNAELASTAMNLVQKKEFLLKITDELNKLNKPGKDTIENTELKKIIRSLGSEEKLDEEWKQFSIHFNKVHSDFLVTLKNKHPNLSAHELKLCAYLRMNLTSKEMAQLMSISVRGVEINRYRLRKKLQLQPKEDLFQFLLSVEASNKSNT